MGVQTELRQFKTDWHKLRYGDKVFKTEKIYPHNLAEYLTEALLTCTCRCKYNGDRYRLIKEWKDEKCSLFYSLLEPLVKKLEPYRFSCLSMEQQLREFTVPYIAEAIVIGLTTEQAKNIIAFKINKTFDWYYVDDIDTWKIRMHPQKVVIPEKEEVPIDEKYQKEIDKKITGQVIHLTPKQTL